MCWINRSVIVILNEPDFSFHGARWIMHVCMYMRTAWTNRREICLIHTPRRLLFLCRCCLAKNKRGSKTGRGFVLVKKS